jgi:hypothetical protein
MMKLTENEKKHLYTFLILISYKKNLMYQN